MTLEYTQNDLGKIKTIFEGACEQAIDCELNLPDYCPDILRVLKCTVTAGIVSSKISGDRACADGNATIKLIYTDDEDNLCTAEQNIPFSKYVETGSDNEGALFVSSKSEFVNCRALNKRKAEIHGSIRLIFKICKAQKQDFLSSIETQSVETKSEEFEYSSATACECKLFPLNETAELPGDYLPAERIINVCAVPVLSEAKIIKGKILLKGETAVTVIYCTQDNKGECVKYDYSIPVNQVIEAQGLDDEGFADVRLKITECSVSPEPDADGNNKFFNINIVASAEICGYSSKTSSFIFDAYSTDGELNAEYETIELLKLSKSVNETFTQTQKFDFSSVSAEKINALWFGEAVITSNENSTETEGKVPVYFIISDSSGKSVFCEREFEFKYKIKDENVCVPSEAQICVLGYSSGSVNSGTAEVKAEFNIICSTFSAKKEKIMTGASINQEKRAENSAPGIVIYFPDENEKMWDIARKYGTTCEKIKKENSLTSDEIKPDEPILIPCS